MIIAVDFDDVVADFYHAYLAFHNKKYGTSFAKEQLTRVDFAGICDIENEEWLSRVHSFIENDFLDSVHPILHAPKHLYLLSRRHTLHLVTSRSQRFADVTLLWSKRHYIEGCFSDFHFCGNEAGNAHHREKNDVCKDIGAQVLIDDHPRHLFRCVADNINALVFDQPWNRHIPEGERISRVTSWKGSVIRSL